ncbi:MAG TPA: UbiA family prenyltransferase, partial [Candidatus Eisenbacteria bacterium]|nr:UbiA family prenyltransferase [Candidatus Eisenbacteria bacterium]
MNNLFLIFLSLRPNAWVRIAAEILLGAALVPHAVNNLPLLCVGFFILGPCIAGGSYILNDITDKKYDSLHPLRRDRPIASNHISVRTAYSTVLVLYLFSLVCSYAISFPLFIACIFLIVSEVLYTMPPFRYKEVFFLDIFLNAINAGARFSSGFY